MYCWQDSFPCSWVKPERVWHHRLYPKPSFRSSPDLTRLIQDKVDEPKVNWLQSLMTSTEIPHICRAAEQKHRAYSPKMCHILLVRSKFQACLHSREKIIQGTGHGWSCGPVDLLPVTRPLQCLHSHCIIHYLAQVHLLGVSSRRIHEKGFLWSHECWAILISYFYIWVTFVCP